MSEIKTSAPSIDEILKVAIEQHIAGQSAQAESLYRSVLQANPQHAEASHHLGMLLVQMGKAEPALEYLRMALEVEPENGDYWLDYAEGFMAAGQPQQALEVVQQAMQIGLDTPAAKDLQLRAMQAIAPPASTEQELADLFAAARYDELVSRAMTLVSQYPNWPVGWKMLSATLLMQGKDARLPTLRALELSPDDAEEHCYYGIVLKNQGELDAAVKSFQRALELRPNYSEAHNNLGNVLKDLGEFDAAIASYRRALVLKPDNEDAESNLLFCLNYHPDMSAEEIYRAYQEYDAKRGIPLRSTWRAHGNDKNPNRRLRIGYVSPDFRLHSCRTFLEPLLSHHDKTRVEVYAYAELVKEDHQTARYKSYVEHWIPTKGMSDEALAERIRSDGVDILVELAGHTAGSRLRVFARKPAPVSLSWLGYGYTTGLSAIDYYLTDEACVPAGSEGLFSEQPWRIATPAYSYRPTDGMGEVSKLPALQRGHITFGTLSRSVRINHRIIRVWAALLNAVPNSRLVMDSLNFQDPPMQERMAASFAEHGISRDRLEIGFHSPPWDVLRGIDISLDCFPHNSGTTLFESLYMGVPYITLADRPSVGRLGSCILQGVGHPEWIAENEADYIAKGVELASDVERLAALRVALRGEMERSPLMDEAGFAHKVEEAYRKMWQRWCAGHLPED